MWSKLTLSVAVAICFTNPGWSDAQMGGIGISFTISAETKQPRIARVLPESPAAKAGLSVGWTIRSIAGVPTVGKSVADCVALVRGPVGTEVALEMVSKAGDRTNDVKVPRAVLSAAAAIAKLGAPAAPLSIKKWIKGGPLDVRDGKHIYVVEFWATWCGPCRFSIPHLTELQKKFRDKGVVVVGISDEDAAKVQPFVETMGAKMDYAVACDDEQESYSGYMDAYGRSGIPSAFVVGKDGKVLWTGHPLAGLEKALAELTGGIIQSANR